MEVRVLGTAQDGGVPHLGCSCAVCERAREDPARQRYASSLLVRAGEGRYLVDASPDVRFQVEGTDLDGVFLTHEHLGHLPGLLYLGRESLDASALPVHCTPAMAEFVRSNQPLASLIDRGHVDLRPVEPGTAVDLGDGTAVPRAVAHRAEFADVVAYEFAGDRTLLYLPDVDGWTARAKRLVADADVALVDGTFWHPDELDRYEEVPHPAMAESVDRLDPDGTDVQFTHLNHTNAALRPDSAEREWLRKRGFGVVERGAAFDLG